MHVGHSSLQLEESDGGVKGNNPKLLHGPSMFAVKAKIIECYIIKPAQSLLMKHLVIGQR